MGVSKTHPILSMLLTHTTSGPPVMLADFGLKNGYFETPTTKTDILTFLENKWLFARTTYIRLLIYLKAIYGQKMKEIDFSTLATRWSIFPYRRS